MNTAPAVVPARPVPTLFLIQHLNVGGTEHHLHDLLRGIDRTCVEPHLIHFNDRDGKVALRIYEESDLARRFIPVSKAYSRDGLAAAWKVRRYIREHNIAAVVTFHFVADFIGMLATRGMRRRPVLISSRRDMGFTRTSRQVKLGRFIARWGVVDRYIAVSEAVRGALGKDEGIAQAKIEVIYNGADLDSLQRCPWQRDEERRKLGIGGRDLVIGCVANFNQVKRHTDLVAAFGRLRESSPDQHARLLLAGTGPMMEQVRGEAEALGLKEGEDVLFIGQSADPTREFVVADIVALASETEGFSNSIVQAMALRRPVVACAVGGNTEAIADGVTGLLVAPRNVDALSAALVKLGKDEELRKQMGDAGAARAEELFSLRTMLKRTEALIATLAPQAH